MSTGTTRYMAAFSALSLQRFAVCCRFFLYCCDAHEDLHSFPTRRSSDLGQVIYGIKNGVRDFIYNTGPNITKDRKSTRLNSSHVAISYAVFCLKKKMAWPWGSSST